VHLNILPSLACTRSFFSYPLNYTEVEKNESKHGHRLTKEEKIGAIFTFCVLTVVTGGLYAAGHGIVRLFREFVKKKPEPKISNIANQNFGTSKNHDKLIKNKDPFTPQKAPSINKNVNFSNDNLKCPEEPSINENVKFSNDNLKCPEKFAPFYARAPKEFTTKILNSPLYTKKEKEQLFPIAKEVYADEYNKVITRQSWVPDSTTMGYLSSLSTTYPHFHTLPVPGHTWSQFDERSLTFSQIERGLPKERSPLPSVYAHAVRVNGNHRTAFLIDFENQTVEYYNSFGKDCQAVRELVKGLSNKYGVTFTYQHKTEGICLQQDGYECGIWSCKLIEERLKKGKDFNPKECINFDIAGYRTKVLSSLFELSFYRNVGTKLGSS
jgi:hypothetical protein